MIKANELRVNNLVHSTDERGGLKLPTEKIFQVLTVDPGGCIICPIDLNPAQQKTLPTKAVCDLEPVRLDYKLIEKLGIESQENEGVTYYGVPDDEGNWIFEFYSFLNGYQTVMTDVHFKYAHELQNLVFALRKKELTYGIL